jgi:hypothetical protein
MGAVFLLQAKVAARFIPRFDSDGAIWALVGERSHFILGAFVTLFVEGFKRACEGDR